MYCLQGCTAGPMPARLGRGCNARPSGPHARRLLAADTSPRSAPTPPLRAPPPPLPPCRPGSASATPAGASSRRSTTAWGCSCRVGASPAAAGPPALAGWLPACLAACLPGRAAARWWWWWWWWWWWCGRRCRLQAAGRLCPAAVLPQRQQAVPGWAGTGCCLAGGVCGGRVGAAWRRSRHAWPPRPPERLVLRLLACRRARRELLQPDAEAGCVHEAPRRWKQSARWSVWGSARGSAQPCIPCS